MYLAVYAYICSMILALLLCVHVLDDCVNASFAASPLQHPGESMHVLVSAQTFLSLWVFVTI